MPRDRLLLFVLLGVAALAGGSYTIQSRVLEPLEQRRGLLAEVEDKVSDLDDQLHELAVARQRMTNWQKSSLPPDPPSANKKARRSALLAQRLYQEWLLDLAHACGFESLEVTPGTQRTRGNVYIAVIVNIEAEARYEQLVRFLDLFERTAVLHRVTSLDIDSTDNSGDPTLKFKLSAEGLAMLDAPVRRVIFPRTSLTAEVGEETEQFQVAAAKDFPTKPGFTIRLGTEFCEVAQIEGETWTVLRGRERSVSSVHQKGEAIELMPFKTDQTERSPEEWKEFVARSIFVKPAPPFDYRLKIAPPGEKAVTRGKTLEFVLAATGFNPSLGKPEFQFVGEKPPGVSIDRSTGKVSWKPADGQPAGKFTAKVEVKHPSAEGGKLTLPVTLVLREPNTPPKRDDSPAPTVYLGREWKGPPPIVDAETPREQLKFKLGDNPPQGLTYDEASGQLVWTPPETLKAGDVTASLVVTDNGEPAETATIPIQFKVSDDHAQFTYLVGVVARGDVREAWLFDRSQDRRTVLKTGESFSISGIDGLIESIARDHVTVRVADEFKRLYLGQHLRDLEASKGSPAGPQPADALKPTNTASSTASAANPARRND